MLSLLGSTHKLMITMDASPAANQPIALISTDKGENPTVTLTGATPKEALAGVDGIDKGIKEVLIYNKDTATVNVSISRKIGSTDSVLLREDIPAGGTLFWSPGSSPVVTSGAVNQTVVVGASAQPEVAAAEGGFETIRKTVLTLTNMPMTITDALTYVGKKIYDMPEGRIKFLGAVAKNMTFTTSSVIASTLNSGVTCSWGLGTATASSATLSSTMMNLIPGTGESVKSFTSSTTINVAPTAVNGFTAAVSAAQLGAIVDGTATPVDLYLNVAVPTNTDIDADATILVSGEITIHWVNEGDV